MIQLQTLRVLSKYLNKVLTIFGTEVSKMDVIVLVKCNV